MIIGIEAERANNPIKTGVEHYAKQLILHLAQIDKQNRYVLYLRTQPEEWLLKLPDNFRVKVIPFPIFWTQIRISLEMLFNPVDVLFIPASALPLIHPKNSFVTIHDIAWKFFPQAFTPFMRNYLEFSTWYAVKRAKKVIAVSESTKKDLVNYYRIRGDKIAVVPMGYEAGDLGLIVPSPEIKEKLPQKYILFLSVLQPRKNLPGLISAFRRLKQEHPELPHKLVVVGRMGWKYENIIKSIEDNSDIVVYLNYLSDSDRWAVLGCASLLVLPSFYEGFGMQILEAMHAGVPIATSNISSMPEVAGEAAVYFDPHRGDEIKQAIAAVLLDPDLSGNLVRAGKERLKTFSWAYCARETWQVLTS